MKWEPLNPRPRDFCGCPPCPKCFRPVDDSPGKPPMAPLAALAFDLLGRAAESKAEERKVKKIGDELHAGAIKVPKEPRKKPPPEAIDLGMTATRHAAGLLRQMRPAKKTALRVLTCDEIADRQAQRAAVVAAQAKEREERLAPMREAAELFAEVQGRQERERRREEAMLEGVDPDFVRMWQAKGAPAHYIRREWEMRTGMGRDNECVSAYDIVRRRRL